MKDETLAKIGKVLDGTEGRDAVHVAVLPAIAGTMLRPGSHVGLDTEGKVMPGAEPLLGIVDPYLRRPVMPGQWCYGFLYPQTITSLRHEWTHPAIKP